VGDLNEFCSEVPNWFSISKHPHRNCIYDEIKAVVKLKGIDLNDAFDQHRRYDIDGFPKNFGLGENGVMLRDLSDKKVHDICDMWWDEYSKGIKRDQCSLMYCFWKLGYMPDLFSQSIFNKYFVCHRKHG
ncbi:unnamed protein product, partial [marine sediment metagenome]